MLRTSSISTKNFFEKAKKKILISENRYKYLIKIAETIAKKYRKNELVNLNFICINNSRRSQLAQVWSFFAAHYFNLNIRSFSGGTEIGCFNRSSIKTLQKVGFSFQLNNFSHQNPTYQISFEGNKETLTVFSKLFDDTRNPNSFIGIMTCAVSDENIPFITSANQLFQLPFEDPKRADGTLRQEEVYLATNRRIAGEIFIIFNEVKQLLT